MISDKLKDLLKDLDSKEIRLSYMWEYGIARQINDTLKDKDYLTTEEIAESIAFDFSPDYKEDLDWNTYYGPKSIFPDQNDSSKVKIYPHISQINDKIIEYWEKRAKESNNLILKSRYADLVIDFFPKILWKRANSEFYNIVINSNIEIIKNNLVDSLLAQTKLKRALDLELEIKKEVSKKLINIIVELDKKGEIDKPWTWGFAFKWLLLNKNKKIKLDNSLKEKLLNNLLQKFEKGKKDPYILEYVVSLLAEYYSKENDIEKLLKILLEFEIKYKNIFVNSDSLLKINAYNKILEIFTIYSKFSEIRKEKDRLINEIGNLELDWEKDLTQISINVEIPNEKIKKLLDSIFGINKDESLENVILKIVYWNLPKKEKLKDQYIELFSKSIMSNIGTKQIIDGDGVLKAKISWGLKENILDLNNPQFTYEITNYLQYWLPLLGIVFEEFKKNFTKEEVLKYFKNKILFKDSKEILDRILVAYYKNDYLVFSHLASPFLEYIIRNFIKITGGNWITTNGYGGYQALTLSKILNDKYNQEIFKYIFWKENGEDIIFYLKLSLIEKLWLDIRTDIAHWKDIKKYFNRSFSDLLLHILLLFSFIDQKK